jgi:hypothetical protein
MKLFIRAAGNISPQRTFGQAPLLASPVEHVGNRLPAVEPDYKSFIDVKLIRRMSRIIKMGVAAAMECLQQAGVGVPDAVVTGTAYGCLEDTNAFLSKMVEQEEELLTPYRFHSINPQYSWGTDCIDAALQWVQQCICTPGLLI